MYKDGSVSKQSVHGNQMELTPDHAWDPEWATLDSINPLKKISIQRAAILYNP